MTQTPMRDWPEERRRADAIRQAEANRQIEEDKVLSTVEKMLHHMKRGGHMDDKRYLELNTELMMHAAARQGYIEAIRMEGGSA